MSILFLQPLLIEAQVLARRLERAEQYARSALVLVGQHHARGWKAMLLRLLGQIVANRIAPDFAEAEQFYRHAVTLASELFMRPLVAHCHSDFGELYRRRGKFEQAQEHLATATTMYRDMGMIFWLDKAEAALKALR